MVEREEQDPSGNLTRHVEKEKNRFYSRGWLKLSKPPLCSMKYDNFT